METKIEKAIDLELLNQEISIESSFLNELKKELAVNVIGQEKMIESLLIGLLSNGHVLLEGLPGLAKTLAIKSIARAIDAGFSRIQFTPDLLPADILGTMIYNPSKSEFTVRKGPIFSNLILADEINRAPAKVQSALLEVMQERQVTIGGESYKMEEPFLVMATQNPIEQEGTYTLPEAQADRFMLKVKIGYPSIEEERMVMRLNLYRTDNSISIKPVISPQSILRARHYVEKIYMDEKIETYILNIVFATRYPGKYGLQNLENLIQYGASPRASINLALASKAMAFLRRRAYVIPEDVKSVCERVLCHRIGLTYEAEAENISSEEIISMILAKIEVP